jgi:very-short-patch-repair endonuclease
VPVSNIVIGQKVSRELREGAKELRKNMTPAEKILWEMLRHNRLNGLQFRRQQIINPYIVDFYCHAKALVVEVDGDIHDLQEDYDAERSSYLTARGFCMLRVRNDDVVQNLIVVVEKITPDENEWD